jgi:hypothetical protein
MVPLYLPLTLDGATAGDTPTFFGGTNVYPTRVRIIAAFPPAAPPADSRPL